MGWVVGNTVRSAIGVLSLCVFATSARSAQATPPPPPTQRLGALATFSPVTGQADTWAVWAGPIYGHRLFFDALWGYLGVGYLTVREDADVGSEAVSPLLGLELHTNVVVEGLEVLGRAVLTVDRAIGSVVTPPVPLRGFTLQGQAGLRYWLVEVFVSAGAGPAEGFGLGVGAAITIPFGREHPPAAGPPDARLY